MKKLIHLLVLSVFIFCSSLLSAVTVNFPTDQPVMQKIEDWGRKVRFNPNLSYKRMHTLLTLKEINSNFWNLEASYLEGWYGDPAPEEVSLIKVSPDSHRYFGDIADTSALVWGTVGATGALTYGDNPFLDLYLATLWHLHGRVLAVGDLFTIRSQFVTCKYEILGIHEEHVDYAIKVDHLCPMEGVGFWNRKNGLVGQFYIYGLDKRYELRFHFSSFPQE